MATLPRQPSFLEYNGWKFLIVDCPTNESLTTFVPTLQKYNVAHLVRVCECDYSTQPVLDVHIEVHDWPFEDGQPPPPEVVDEWLKLVYMHFAKRKSDQAIAVHCVAGLGRAPALVAIALIERGMEPLEAVRFIRERRKGAINRQQIAFLEHYKPRRGKCTLL